MQEHNIDARGKRIGRIASQAASLLMGKNLTSFVRNAVPDVKVNITNTSKADIIAKKKGDKVYTWYTGFRGGLKTEKLGDLVERKGYGEAFKKAVYRMLPPNSLRKKIIKNLTVSE